MHRIGISFFFILGWVRDFAIPDPLASRSCQEVGIHQGCDGVELRHILRVSLKTRPERPSGWISQLRFCLRGVFRIGSEEEYLQKIERADRKRLEKKDATMYIKEVSF